MKQRRIKNWLLIFMVLNISLTAQADNGQSLMPIVPTSPQAEAIQRYGKYEVNNSTGTPDIAVPLFEINHRGYQMPMVLRYSPQPLKPGYNYDVFGHGWSLSVNSCISRSIESIPDEWRDFKIETNKLSDTYHIFEAIGACNFSHDKFSATLPNGTSFDFVIDKSPSGALEYIVSNGVNVKISCVGVYNISSFTVIDDQGVKYTFDGSDTPYMGSDSQFRNSFVSWYLTRIDLPHSTEPILFAYNHGIESKRSEPYNEKNIKISHKFDVVTDVANAQLVPDYGSYTYKMKLLSSIQYGSTQVLFDYQNQSPTATHNYVNRIRITDNNVLVKSIDFDMAAKQVRYPTASADELTQLSRIILQGPGSANDSQIYKCTYNSIAYSFSGTDHWGYLNEYDSSYGTCNFTVFVEADLMYYNLLSGLPATKVNKTAQDVCPFDKIRLSRYAIDHRQPSDPERHGVLATLQYPTGGSTRFEFENHWFLTSTSEEGDYIYDRAQRRRARGGGFRIRKITNYTSDNTISDMKTYRYGKTCRQAYLEDGYDYWSYVNTPDSHTGLGEAVIDPTILSYASYTFYWTEGYSTRNMILGLNANGQRLPFIHPFRTGSMANHEWSWECTFSVSNFRRILNGRTPVVYSDITVYHGDIEENGLYTPWKTSGKTESKYDIYVANTDHVFFETPQYYGNVMSYEAKPYLYNLLKEKNDYKYDGSGFSIVRKEKRNWNFIFRSVYEYEFGNTYPEYHYPMHTTIGDLLISKSPRLGHSLLSSTLITTYDTGGNSIAESEGYSYNSRDQLIEKRVQNSNSQNFRTTFTYPQAPATGTTPAIIQQLLDKNMIAPVLNQVKSVQYPQPVYEDASGYQINYQAFAPEGTSILMPAELYELDAKSPTGTYVLKDKIISYSLHGNPVEVVSREGLNSVFLWSYNYRYLIAEVKNATYAQVESAVQSVFGVDIQTLAKQSQPDESKLRSLKNHANLNQALVSTYTYKPLVGATSMTDPSGIVTYYDYDGLGQLKEVYYYEGNVVSAANKRVVQQYKYNYRNQ